MIHRKMSRTITTILGGRGVYLPNAPSPKREMMNRLRKDGTGLPMPPLQNMQNSFCIFSPVAIPISLNKRKQIVAKCHLLPTAIGKRATFKITVELLSHATTPSNSAQHPPKRNRGQKK